MNVKELKEQLSRFRDEEEVFFEHPSHDYWRTRLASPVDKLEQDSILYSRYHEQHAFPRSENEDEEAAEEGKRVVVLRSR